MSLAAESTVKPFKHPVERVGKLAQVVAPALQSDALRQVLFCRG
jgi:hypothetical protein